MLGPLGRCQREPLHLLHELVDGLVHLLGLDLYLFAQLFGLMELSGRQQRKNFDIVLLDLFMFLLDPLEPGKDRLECAALFLCMGSPQAFLGQLLRLVNHLAHRVAVFLDLFCSLLHPGQIPLFPVPKAPLKPLPHLQLEDGNLSEILRERNILVGDLPELFADIGHLADAHCGDKKQQGDEHRNDKADARPNLHSLQKIERASLDDSDRDQGNNDYPRTNEPAIHLHSS